VLEGGSARPVRRRRWPTAAGALGLAAVAALLAARSAPDPAPRPAPTAAPTRAAAPVPERSVVSVAVGRRALYALVARCDGAAVPTCGYQVYRRAASTGTWQSLPWQLSPRNASGVPPVIEVTGDEVVTVLTGLDGGEAQTSSDDGITVTTRRLTGGPAAAAVPAGGLLDAAYCVSCQDGITVVEPRTGRVRRLAAQPPLAGLPVGSFDRNGDVLWAVAAGAGAARSTVSTDGGRSWRVVPLPPIPGAAPLLQVVAAADGSAWLITGSFQGGPPEQLTGLRRIDGPGGRWRTLPLSGPRTIRSALAGTGGLLVIDVGGSVWRLPPDGRFVRLADPGLYRPGTLVRGPRGRLASVSPDDARNRTVLVSEDDGGTWRPEQVF
jgi:hypothetical protein